MFFLFTFPALAAASAPELIRLVINGQRVATDVAPQIIGGRTLVPARVIAETLGAQVHWETKTRRVTVQLGDTTVTVTLDSRTAGINGQAVTLDVPAKVVNGRTLVPLRFISEALGARVEWDGKVRLVTVERFPRLTGIRFEPGQGSGRLVLAADGPVTFSARAVAAVGEESVTAGDRSTGVTLLSSHSDNSSVRPRIIIDLPGAEVARELDGLVVGEGSVRLVRAAVIPGDIPTARVTVELARPVAWEARPGEAPGQVVLEIRYQLTAVEVREGEGLLLRMNDPAEPRAEIRSDPDRLVLNLPGLTRGEAVAALSRPYSSVVREVRVEDVPASDQSPAGVRVEARLTGAADHRLETTPEGIRVRFLNRVTGVSWKQDGPRTRLIVETSLPGRFESRRGDQPGTVVVTVAEAVSALPGGQPPAPSGKVTAARLTSEADPPTVRLIFSVQDLVEFTDAIAMDGRRLVVEAQAGALAGRLIAIDPGHGGSDPGAIGPRGTYEKEINLAISHKVRELLDQAGARVLMTRTGDQPVGLYERAYMANDAGADIFVSIHVNALDRPGVGGTETYHHPSAAAGKILAEAIHRRMVAALGRPDRGVLAANFVVVREPKMPSALAEIAYLSNPEEERLLRTEEFQWRAAQAIVQGITDYLKMNGQGV